MTLTIARILLLLVLGTASVTIAQPVSAAVGRTPSDPDQADVAEVAKVCRQARRLNQLGEPAIALQTIRDLRTAIAPAAQGQDPVCAGAFGRAVKRQARAAALARWAASAQAVVDAAEGENPTVDIPPRVPASCQRGATGDPEPWQRPVRASDATDKESLSRYARRAVSSALVCDQQSASAIALLEKQSAAEAGVPEQAKKTWNDTKTKNLDPWVPLILGFLGMLAVGLALARVLLLLVTRDVATLMTWFGVVRPALLVVGWALLLLGAVLGVGGWSLLTVDPPLSWPLSGSRWLIVIVALLAVMVAASVRRLPATAARSASFLKRWDAGRAVLVAVALALTAATVALAVLTEDVGLGADVRPLLGRGAAVAAVGSLLLALGWSAGRGLTIVSSGEAAPKPEAIRSLIQRMAPDSPRGVEVPNGTDADLLSAIGVVESSSIPIVGAAIRVLKLLRPPTPWQLTVTATSADNLACTLTRNHRTAASFAEERGNVFEFLTGVSDPAESARDASAQPGEKTGEKTDSSAAPDLVPFAAALAIVQIATETNATKGLAGATSWRSVGLQYLAAQQRVGSATGRALWAEAMSLDRRNLLARTGYWHALYRTATTAAEMKRYQTLLNSLLTDAGGELTKRDRLVLDHEPSLKVRLLYMRVAIGINRRALAADDAQAEPDAEALEGWALQLRGAVAEDITNLEEDFRKTMARRVDALLLSVPGMENDLNVAEPEGEGPYVNYSLACYRASKMPPEYDRAVRSLRLADTRPSLAKWREEDPQLSSLRSATLSMPGVPGRSNPYRQEYGKQLPVDVLKVPPFDAHADKLRAAGAVTLDRIAVLPERFDPTLRRATVVWLRRVARLGQALEREASLRPWHLPMMSGLAARGIATRAGARATAGLLEEMVKHLAVYQSSPRKSALRRWLEP